MAGAAIGSMRGSKLSAKEAAILTGELQKPSWESRNEGIHERVSFEDSIWGFDLAGGSYYNTPLRVTAVKRDSRADKAGIRPGDKLLRINDIDTSTLTIQEAHEIIIESGIYIRLAVSAPDDIEDSYNCYQDPTEEIAEMERQRKAEKEAERWKRIQEKFKQTHWSLEWPWVSKRRVIYRESNCFMVPSKYEDRHREKFPAFKAALKKDDKFELFSSQTHTPTGEMKQLLFPKPGKVEENSGLSDKDSNNNDIVNDKSIGNVLKGEKSPMEVSNGNMAGGAQRNGTVADVSEHNDINDTDDDEVNEELNEETNEGIDDDTNEDINEEINGEKNEETNEDITEKAKQEIERKNINDIAVESEEADEEDEFDQWDPNDNEGRTEDMEEIFNEEEDMNVEDQNKVIDDVLKDELDDTESSKLDNEI